MQANACECRTIGVFKINSPIIIFPSQEGTCNHRFARRIILCVQLVMFFFHDILLQSRVTEAVDLLKKEGLSVSGVVCHVGKKQDREHLIDEALKLYGGLDILVSNAAVNPAIGPFLETSEQAWDKIYEINIKAAAMLTALSVPHMQARGGGSVIYVSSIGGYVPFEVLGAYSVSKTALLGLTKAMARECGPKKVRVNCVAPGVIKTKFSEVIWSNPTLLDDMLKNIPLKRIGEPADCAGTVSFLCSDDAEYITGETVVISGGMVSRL